MTQINKPSAGEFHEFYAGYVNQVADKDVFNLLQDQKIEFIDFINTIPEDKFDFAYAPRKWTIKQLVRHIIDAERMFGLRAMSIARGEQAMLPGFDEQSYVDQADDSNNSMQELLQELEYLRSSNLQMISNFPSEAMERMGNANGSEISVRAIIFIIAGHLAHHKQIITERYIPHV